MSHLMNTYARLPVAFTHGQGAWLYDAAGNKYLDALAGIAVNGLGHAHPQLVAALRDQVGRLIHTSNVYRVTEQEQLADRLCALSGMQEVFFGNSGAEANEGALKLVRFLAHKQGEPEAQTIVMEHAWHGRTLATLAATGSDKAHKGFEPLPGGFIRVPYNDLAAIENVAARDKRVRAVWLEVLQGEGGIRVADVDLRPRTAPAVRRHGLAADDRRGAGGIGRTGKWFGYQWADIVPDVMTLAKGLGSGVPIGAVPGAPARPPACSVPATTARPSAAGRSPAVPALATLRIIEADGLMDNAAARGRRSATASPGRWPASAVSSRCAARA